LTTTVAVHDVVAFLLSKAHSHLSISALHKMSCYVQGRHLAWQGTPLFDEELQARGSGPVVPALYPFHEKDPYTATAWPAGNATAVTGDTARITESVFDSYGHQSGLIMGENAKTHAPYLFAKARATDEEPHQAIGLSELRAFFKALDDAPADQIAYANRFMGNYAGEAVRCGQIAVFEP
jgi:uncharacterized phage-associated protein